jgi:hypothetical protein
MVVCILALVVIIGVAGTTPPHHKSFYRNLKVSPQDISKEAMHKIMSKEFEDGLGVKCDYCHAKRADDSTHLDFASDANTEKDIARSMMRMALQLNKENFKVQQPLIGDSLMVITCYTCHHGGAFPDVKSGIPVAHQHMPFKK